jgi:hypothetical protein
MVILCSWCQPEKVISLSLRDRAGKAAESRDRATRETASRIAGEQARHYEQRVLVRVEAWCAQMGVNLPSVSFDGVQEHIFWDQVWDSAHAHWSTEGMDFRIEVRLSVIDLDSDRYSGNVTVRMPRATHPDRPCNNCPHLNDWGPANNLAELGQSLGPRVLRPGTVVPYTPAKRMGLRCWDTSDI